VGEGVRTSDNGIGGTDPLPLGWSSGFVQLAERASSRAREAGTLPISADEVR
jgi:hypothetical protein